MKFLPYLFVAALAALVSCNLPDGPALPESEVPTTTPTGTELFSPEADGYLFQTNEAAKKGKTFLFTSDALTAGARTFEVEVSKSYGSSSGGFGLVFQYKDSSNFWLADIDVSGGYFVAQVVNNVVTPVTGSSSYSWSSSTALVKGYGVVNRLAVVFDGAHQYRLDINGSAVLDFTDSQTAPAAASWGFNAGVLSYEAFPDIPVQVRFKVLQPSGLTFSN